MSETARITIHKAGDYVIAESEGDGILLRSAADLRDLLMRAYSAKADSVAVDEANIAP